MSHYWANYGRCGFLGRFVASESFQRGDFVAVRSPRGKESATILGPVDERISQHETCGEILGFAFESNREVTPFLSEAAEAASGLPLLVADLEWLDDGHTAILHVMPFDNIDLSPWAEQLSQSWQVDVRLLNLGELPVEKLDPTKCGKPNCGSGCGDCGSGCSTGSCSKGSVKSADDLTKYFLSLRQAMDEKRTSLN